MFCNCFLTFCLAAAVFNSANCDEYDDAVIFTVSNDNESFEWKTGTDLTSQGCDASGKFAFILHGWQGHNNVWQQQLADKLLEYRGGCVIVVKYQKYSEMWNFPWVVMVHFPKISSVIRRRLQSLESSGVSPSNIYMYGHSMGARLVIDAGIKFGKGKIGQIDACDSAGPGFLAYDLVDSRNAAKNVQCIHTSAAPGTTVYRCHQDWLMGKCGIIQPAADPLLWTTCRFGFCPSDFQAKLSHDLCNDFYINAFENDFVANNHYNCSSSINTQSLPPNFKMGYMEDRKSSAIQGRIAAPTSKYSPYTGFD